MNAPGLFALIIWSAVLSIIDIRTRRLPDALTLPGALVVVVLAAVEGHGLVAAAGALLLAGPYLAVHLISPPACGGGDVKLALGTGAAAACGGAHSWVWAALAAPVLTAAAGTGALLGPRLAGLLPHGATERTRHVIPGLVIGRRTGGPPVTVPHGPAMCLATVAALWPTV